MDRDPRIEPPDWWEWPLAFTPHVELRMEERDFSEAVRTEQFGPDLLIDYAADGSPLGLEVISPGYVTEEEINSAFERLGLQPPSSDDLAPLRAA